MVGSARFGYIPPRTYVVGERIVLDAVANCTAEEVVDIIASVRIARIRTAAKISGVLVHARGARDVGHASS